MSHCVQVVQVGELFCAIVSGGTEPIEILTGYSTKCCVQRWRVQYYRRALTLEDQNNRKSDDCIRQDSWQRVRIYDVFMTTISPQFMACIWRKLAVRTWLSQHFFVENHVFVSHLVWNNWSAFYTSLLSSQWPVLLEYKNWITALSCICRISITR